MSTSPANNISADAIIDWLIEDYMRLLDALSGDILPVTRRLLGKSRLDTLATIAIVSDIYKQIKNRE